MICPSCKAQNLDGTLYCSYCGSPLEDSVVQPAETYTQSNTYTGAPGPAYPDPKRNPSRDWAAIAALVCGILSLPCSILYFSSLAASVPAMVFSVIGMRSTKKGLAIAGLICGIFSILLTLMFVSIRYDGDWDYLYSYAAFLGLR